MYSRTKWQPEGKARFTADGWQKYDEPLKVAPMAPSFGCLVFVLGFALTVLGIILQ